MDLTSVLLANVAAGVLRDLGDPGSEPGTGMITGLCVGFGAASTVFELTPPLAATPRRLSVLAGRWGVGGYHLSLRPQEAA